MMGSRVPFFSNCEGLEATWQCRLTCRVAVLRRLIK
jgi:hypothetical protein